MGLKNIKGFLLFLLFNAIFLTNKVTAQTNLFDSVITETPYSDFQFHNTADTKYQFDSFSLQSSTYPFRKLFDSDEDETIEESENRKTSSLTAGYISDEFNIESDDGSYRFRFNGEATALLLGSKSSSLMLSYGVAGAEENEGDIRSITADLNLGNNIAIFRRFLGLPIGSFIPIRANLGYRNLELLHNPNSNFNSTANIGMGSLGAGLGTEIRIPTGLPLLKDNLTAFAHLVTSAGAIGDFTSAGNEFQSGGKTLSGIRLTKRTDFTFEAKFERLLGNKTGVSVGLTMRWLHWTQEEAEDVKQVLNVFSGKHEGLELRATQSFFRVGINW